MECTEKRTKFQPTEEQWVCPVCGAGLEDFYIDECDCEWDECSFLHDCDIVTCRKCDKLWTGSSVAAKMAKLANLVQCPHCKGKGMVAKEKTK